MATLAVIPDLDPFEDGPSSRGTGRPDLGVDELGFQGGEETFGQCVIVAVAATAHRHGDILCGERCLIGGGVLGTAIGMVDEVCAGPAGGQSHREGVEREFRAQMFSHRPADDAARMHIQEHREVEPALMRRDVCDIPHPEAIRGRRGKVARDEVLGGQPGGIGNRRARTPTPVATRQAGSAHEAGDPLAGTMDAVGA